MLTTQATGTERSRGFLPLTGQRMFEKEKTRKIKNRVFSTTQNLLVLAKATSSLDGNKGLGSL